MTHLLHNIPRILTDDAVHVIVVPLTVEDDDYRGLEQTLAADELARANRFLIEHVRRRYVVCRGRLRQVLGQVLDRPAGQVEFRYEQWGKPQLVSNRVPQLHFNVSHSEDWGVIALATREVGVDFEIARESFTYRSIASQVLSPAEETAWELLAARERNASMMQLWVCKEALLKAMGLGIADGLRQITFPLPIPTSGSFLPEAMDAALQLHLDDDGTCRMTSWTDRTAWSLRWLNLLPDSFAALATRTGRDNSEIHIHTLE